MACYLLRAGDTDKVKIGLAVDVQKRVGELQAGCWETLHVLRVWPNGSRATEAWLHRKFSFCRLVREWFSFHPDMLTIDPPNLSRPEILMRVIEHFGDIATLARALSITPQSISQWRRVPIEHVRAIEKITGLPKHEIRADVYDALTSAAVQAQPGERV